MIFRMQRLQGLKNKIPRFQYSEILKFKNGKIKKKIIRIF